MRVQRAKLAGAEDHRGHCIRQPGGRRAEGRRGRGCRSEAARAPRPARARSRAPTLSAGGRVWCAVRTRATAQRIVASAGTDRTIEKSGGGGGAGGAGGGAMEVAVRSPHKPALHVNFSEKGEVKERREKFLTAKYGAHQMALIRKRLAVEMWLYDQLQALYADAPAVPKAEGGAAAGAGAAGAGAGGAEDADVEVDMDELLDMDSDAQRRDHLTRLLADAKRPQKDVHKFINELLEKAKTL